MSTEAFRAALEELPDPAFCKGRARVKGALALHLPSGEVGKVDRADFVAWLLAHAEDAPFGAGGETRRDTHVRNAKRLRHRGQVRVEGFDPASVIGAIETSLSPRMHVDVSLVDVILYPEGGHFAPHKDTPRAPNLLGTLVVGLPVEHQGGEFEINDGGRIKRIDWSGAPKAGELPWVALFSDVDHAVKPVSRGARVTLVYALSSSNRPREDEGRDARLAKLRAAAKALTLPKGAPLLIACTRQIVTAGVQPEPLSALRGGDREVAEVLVEAGFHVAVRACLVGSEEKDTKLPDDTQLVTRLSEAIPAEVMASLGKVVSFSHDAEGEYLESTAEVTKLGDYVLDSLYGKQWLVRTRAAATIAHEALYSETGYFGNECAVGFLYTLAALEVTKGSAKAPKQPTQAAAPKIAAPKKAAPTKAVRRNAVPKKKRGS